MARPDSRDKWRAVGRRYRLKMAANKRHLTHPRPEEQKHIEEHTIYGETK